ncbi:MAG: succinylglutamate desuccinylase/aspartoacylase family protein, partial [Armatimonadetes bacterium]|nr:succinylglutamate desuccinylase/aspartoacylase family protein [Armatimonadota bacterium]
DLAAYPPGRTRERVTLGDGLGFDLTVLRGAPGPCLLVIGAVHGDEYEGPAAAGRLAAETDPAALRGTLAVVPVVNEPACFATARCGPDGLNLARSFPGRDDGSPTERVAAAVSRLIAQADAFIDLHAAGTFYTLHPWAGYGMHADPAILGRQRAMAFAFGLDFVWGTPLLPGRSLWTAAKHGVPAIYVEMTGSGLCRAEDVERDLAGVRGVMACLGITNEPHATDPPRWWRESTDESEGHLQVDHPSPKQGLFRPSVALWDEVAEGQVLGHVTSPGGWDPAPVLSSRAGRVAMLRTAPPVAADEYVAVVVHL